MLELREKTTSKNLGRYVNQFSLEPKFDFNLGREK